MVKMKNSGVEWIREIPENWKVIKSKHIIALNDSGVWGADPNGGIHDKIVIRSTEQTIDGKWTIIDPAKRSLENVNYENSRILRDDLLMTKSSGSDLHIGKTTIADDYFDDNECYFSNFIQRIRVKGINPKLVWYIFNSNIAREQFVYLQNSTSGIGNINGDNINNIYMPLGTKSEQNKIVNYLDEKCAKVDSLIKRQQETIEKLTEYKLAVITEAVTKGLSQDVELKDSGARFIGDIPVNWTVSKLKYIALAIGDGIHGTPEYDSDGEIYFVNGNNIGAETLVFKADTNTINKTEYKKYKKPLLNDNTILMTLNGATYGKTSIYNGEEILLGKSAGYITLKPNENKEFVRYYLQSIVAKLIMDYSLCGSTIANVSLRTLNDFAIPYPPKTEQLEIVRLLDKQTSRIDKSINCRQSIVERLIEYKKSLIYEVVTGKKEV